MVLSKKTSTSERKTPEGAASSQSQAVPRSSASNPLEGDRSRPGGELLAPEDRQGQGQEHDPCEARASGETIGFPSLRRGSSW